MQKNVFFINSRKNYAKNIILMHSCTIIYSRTDLKLVKESGYNSGMKIIVYIKLISEKNINIINLKYS